MPSPSQLSPKGSLIVGLIFGAFGVVITLGGLGVLHLTPSEDGPTPPWVLVCVGLMFAFMGVSFIIGSVAGVSGPDGDYPAGTSFSVRLVQYFLGLGIVGSMTAVFTWIAFGPGERHFSTTVALPFTMHRGAASDTSGRVWFGVAAVLLWMFLLGVGVSGARRLFREARK
jgi:hypothetical protein